MISIENLITHLTLEEKISMLAGKDLWHTAPVERLGIPSIRVTDGPNGARGSQGSSCANICAYPRRHCARRNLEHRSGAKDRQTAGGRA